MKVIEINHSIANRFNGYVEINKHLRKYPKLLGPIMKHELQHTNKSWSIEDFKLDFLSNDRVNQWDLLKFMMRHPSSFVQLSPILYSKKKGFVIDVNLLLLYVVIFSSLGVILYFGINNL